ncbi:MAG: GDSL-type esterase/lipase family protein [Candidatus Kuenenbacteria bacterium]
MKNDVEKFNKILSGESVFLFSIGSNDSFYFDTKNNVAIPFDEFKSNLKKIINISKKFTSEIIFTGLTIVDENKTKHGQKNKYWENSNLKKYNDAIKNICNKNNLGFIPLWDVLKKEDLLDGLHPNSNGHKKIFLKVEKYMEVQLP